MTASHRTMLVGPAGKAPREFRASDGFGPLDSPTIPRIREAARTPCLAGRWFSPRPTRAASPAESAPCLAELAQKLVSD